MRVRRIICKIKENVNNFSEFNNIFRPVKEPRTLLQNISPIRIALICKDG